MRTKTQQRLHILSSFNFLAIASYQQRCCFPVASKFPNSEWHHFLPKQKQFVMFHFITALQVRNCANSYWILKKIITQLLLAGKDHFRPTGSAVEELYVPLIEIVFFFKCSCAGKNNNKTYLSSPSGYWPNWADLLSGSWKTAPNKSYLTETQWRE